MDCLRPAMLQDLADGVLAGGERADADLHLRVCPECRDALRALQRVEGYLRHGQAPTVDRSFAESLLDRALAGQFAPERSFPQQAEVRPPAPRPVRSWRARSAPMAAAAAMVGLLLFVQGVPTADPESGDRDTTTPRASEDASASPLERIHAEVPRAEMVRILRSAWHASAGPADRVRVIHAAAAKDVVGFRTRAERLAITAPDEHLEAAVFAVAAFADEEAARALDRVANRRPLPPGVLAEALLRTGSRRVADRVWALLQEDECERDACFVKLHRLPGRAASRVLVTAYVGGDTSPALRRVIAERPDALARLRSELSSVGRAGRTRILTLLGEAGDRMAVPLLERQLQSEETWRAAAHALKRVAHAGSRDALLALARALPLVEDATDFSASAEALVLGAILREMPPGAGATFLEARHATHRATERRRCLIAAGLTGDASVQKALEAGLLRPQERRAALLALAVLGRRSAVEAIRPYAASYDRGTRRCALAALAMLGGDEAARLLSVALRSSSDRRTVMGCIRFTADRWVIPVYVDGLRYRDAREDCLRGLRRLLGGRGPRSGDPQEWRAWLGLEAVNPERT